MCAIFGSFNKSMFEILHDVNQIRGAWGGSYMGVYNLTSDALNSRRPKKTYQIKKWEGKQNNLNKVLELDTFDVYLGHLQAPTGSNRKWSEETTHPFHIGDWIIAHNGVITNQESLIREYNNGIKVSVDSKLIPIMANSIDSKNKTNFVTTIEKALSKLEGTFSLWIYNIKSKKIYIARQGSTLFADRKGNFSSINSKNEWEEDENTSRCPDCGCNPDSPYPGCRCTRNCHSEENNEEHKMSPQQANQWMAQQRNERMRSYMKHDERWKGYY